MNPYKVLISDRKCIVTNNTKGDWEYEFIYTDFANGSVEAVELAESKCRELNSQHN
jgi:hypothetical protein